MTMLPFASHGNAELFYGQVPAGQALQLPAVHAADRGQQPVVMIPIQAVQHQVLVLVSLIESLMSFIIRFDYPLLSYL